MAKSIQCPACRARHDMNRDGAHEARQCRRCGSDLKLLHAVYARARVWQHMARQHMARGQAQAALGAALAAQGLVNSPDTRATLATALALVRKERGPALLGPAHR